MVVIFLIDDKLNILKFWVYHYKKIKFFLGNVINSYNKNI